MSSYQPGLPQILQVNRCVLLCTCLLRYLTTEEPLTDLFAKAIQMNTFLANEVFAVIDDYDVVVVFTVANDFAAAFATV